MGDPKSGGRLNLQKVYLDKTPIAQPCNLNVKNEIINNSKMLWGLNKSLYKNKTRFMSYLQSQFSLDKLSKKLQNWNELEFRDFIKELNKAIKKVGGEKLSKLAEMEWMEVFETKKTEAHTLKAEIDKTDRQIDQMVYELYGLTEEEIKIVEEG